MSIAEVKEDLVELEDKVRLELEQLDGWWKTNRMWWPLGVTAVAIVVMFFVQPWWGDAILGVVAIIGAVKYAELARIRLAEAQLQMQKYKQAMEFADARNKAYLSAVSSVHQAAFMGIGRQNLPGFFNVLWQLAGLETKGAP